MKWKLLALLSLVGVAMGFITLYFIPARYEAIVGTPLFIFCAWFIGRYAEKRHLLHGFVQGVLNSAIVTYIHVAMSDIYFARHPADAAQYAKMSAESGATMHEAMMLMGVFVALVSGLVLGLFSLIGRKAVKTIQGEIK